MAAEGFTEIHRVYHIDRGYQNLERRLCDLGARVSRVSEKKDNTYIREAV